MKGARNELSGSALTTWDRLAEPGGLKNRACKACDPAAGKIVVSVATPELRTETPKTVASSKNVTDPDRVGGLTVAVRVTGLPSIEGFAELDSVIETGNGLETTSEKARGTVTASSFREIVKENGLPTVLMGVPLITPAAESSVRPGGSAPLETAHV